MRMMSASRPNYDYVTLSHRSDDSFQSLEHFYEWSLQVPVRTEWPKRVLGWSFLAQFQGHRQWPWASLLCMCYILYRAETSPHPSTWGMRQVSFLVVVSAAVLHCAVTSSAPKTEFSALWPKIWGSPLLGVASLRVGLFRHSGSSWSTSLCVLFLEPYHWSLSFCSAITLFKNKMIALIYPVCQGSCLFKTMVLARLLSLFFSNFSLYFGVLRRVYVLQTDLKLTM